MGFNKFFLVVFSSLVSASAVFGSTCVWDTAQCGGNNYTGLKNCCSSKSVCTKINDYYSKCIPSTSSCTNKLDSQCGGKDFKNNTCCPSGLTCTVRNEWFSKCMTSSAPDSTKPTSSSCSNKLDSQCGGKDYKGNKCCPSGLKCTYRNAWFSKCLASSTTPSPTPKPTTSSCTNKTDSQCGGKTFTGQTCCPSPLKCTYRNEWFSKCLAPSSPTPSPTTKKPTTPAPTFPPTSLACDNSSDIPCGHSSSGGVSYPDTYCCTGDEECVKYGSSGGHGSYCQIIDRPQTCDPNPCLNGSTCSSDDTGTHCTCINNYSGLFCETPKCTAPEVPCGRASWGNGSSADNKCCNATEDCISDSSPGGTTWSCLSKDRPMTCNPSPCLNGSTCYYYPGSGAYCQCIHGYIGLYCQIML